MSEKPGIVIGKNLQKIRKPVQRRHATTYLLITLLSFAFSVTATRLFLNLTGFPQLGGGGLHFAHVLWGGLLLFIACMLPLIWINQWALRFSSLIAGLGVGLFIDEVGKFITSSNNYFFPSAAPIIYAFFLLTVLVFVQVRQQRIRSARAEMYMILEDFAEVLDRDISQLEYDQMLSKIEKIIEGQEDAQLVALAKSLKFYLKNKHTLIVPHEPDIIERMYSGWKKFEARWLTRNKMRVVLMVGLLLWAAWAIVSQLSMYRLTHNVVQLQYLVEQFMTNNLIRNASGMNWFEAQILLEGAMGVGALISVGFFLVKKDKIGTWIGILDLVITLVVINLLTFYFDQFSTIAFASIQFVLLVLLLSFKRRFIDKPNNQVA
jgi:hypothetical protein